MARKRPADIDYWLSVLPVFQRDKLGSVDEPSRNATEGRSSEGLVRTLVKGIRIAVRDNGNSSSIRTLRACSLNVPCKQSQGTGRRPRRRSTSARVLETPTAAHAMEETPDLLELYSPLIFGRTNERLVNLYLKVRLLLQS
ncbi:hypothetical protein T05_1828 [Trichinella murrelli]|uniref:Uncharacterized protein n=1 Tax=Trichinella murrelli TaxID=144512 RepID=A0A0V0TI95_9BILA|nr:hypothetical protein T05_12158 [Trichinella murrelli]KRX38678.1 hypothetical protein T05_1828 [Trichinella murrelli]